MCTCSPLRSGCALNAVGKPDDVHLENSDPFRRYKMSRLQTTYTSLLLVMALAGCNVQFSAPTAKGTTQTDKSGATAADPAEQAAIDLVKKNGGYVTQE